MFFLILKMCMYDIRGINCLERLRWDIAQKKLGNNALK